MYQTETFLEYVQSFYGKRQPCTSFVWDSLQVPLHLGAQSSSNPLYRDMQIWYRDRPWSNLELLAALTGNPIQLGPTAPAVYVAQGWNGLVNGVVVPGSAGHTFFVYQDTQIDASESKPGGVRRSAVRPHEVTKYVRVTL